MVSDYLLATDAAVEVAMLVLQCYTVYRAFLMRSSLSTGLYRRQALWIGVIGVLAIVTFNTDFAFIFYLPYNTVVDFAVSFLNNGAILVLFGWIDTSALIARRSDPLHRNPISWTLLRKPVWALLIVCDVLVFSLSISYVLAGGSLRTAAPLPELVTLSVFLITPFALGAVLIPLSSARTGDPVLRRHLRWLSVLVLGLFGISILFGSVLNSGQGYGFLDLSQVVVNHPASNLAFFGLLLVLSYALYRSVGSLAPINRITDER